MKPATRTINHVPAQYVPTFLGGDRMIFKLTRITKPGAHGLGYSPNVTFELPGTATMSEYAVVLTQILEAIGYAPNRTVDRVLCPTVKVGPQEYDVIVNVIDWGNVR